MKHVKKVRPLPDRYPPSIPCSCGVCTAYCNRPGWWTVEEARLALDAGLGERMMLELSPGASFGVLSPAFPGCEKGFAVQEYASRGCGFLKNGLCELHDSGLMPLECRFCHHNRPGQGERCHRDIGRDWCSPAGRALVVRWCKETRIFDRYLE